MPSLPLPPGGAPLDGGDVPVSDDADVLAELPRPYQLPETAPVRDAFCEAFAEGFYLYQRLASYAAAQCDPTRATGEFLREIAEERGVVPGPGESDADLRSRLFDAPNIVTPAAIYDRVNAILARTTTKKCTLSELEVDGLFIHDGTVTEWDSFIGTSPRYPDRLYPDDAAENGGTYLEGSDPGGSIPGTGLPRSFYMRLPDLAASDEDFAFIGDPTASDEVFSVIGDGSDTSSSESDGTGATSIFESTLTSEEIYATIVGLVENIKAQGIAWAVYVDPNL